MESAPGDGIRGDEYGQIAGKAEKDSGGGIVGECDGNADDKAEEGSVEGLGKQGPPVFAAGGETFKPGVFGQEPVGGLAEGGPVERLPEWDWLAGRVGDLGAELMGAHRGDHDTV